MNSSDNLECIERLIAMARRCERLAAMELGGMPSHDMVRVVAELRVQLAASPAHADLSRALVASSVESLRIALAGVKARLAVDHRRALSRPAA